MLRFQLIFCQNLKYFRQAERTVNYSEPLFEGETLPKKKKGQTEQTDDVPVIKKTDIDDVDFEKKLEESLKDL